MLRNEDSSQPVIITLRVLACVDPQPFACLHADWSVFEHFACLREDLREDLPAR